METTNHIERMYQLEIQKNNLIFEFHKLSLNEQVSVLGEALALKNYDKRKTDFLLDVLNRYWIDNQVLIQIWKNWLGTTLMHEFNKREGIISFFGANPELKSVMIAEIFAFIEQYLVVPYSDNESYTDEIIVRNAVLLLWDLGYKNALQSLIKKYQDICDEYFDEEDYQKIKNITENEG